MAVMPKDTNSFIHWSAAFDNLKVLIFRCKERVTHAFLVKLYIRFDHELVPLSFPFSDLFFLKGRFHFPKECSTVIVLLVLHV